MTQGPTRRRVAAAALPAIVVSIAACTAGEPSTGAGPGPAEPAVAITVEAAAEDALRAEERALLASTDFTEPKGVDLGADPVRLVSWRGGLVALHRGRGTLVRLGPDLERLESVEAPPFATDLVAWQDDRLLVATRAQGRLSAYAMKGGRLARDPSQDVDLAGVGAVDAVAVDGARVYGVSHDRDLLVWRSGPRTGTRRVAAGPHRVAVTQGFAAVASLEGHALTVSPLDSEGEPTSTRSAELDGPVWAVAATHDGEGTGWFAISGPEDAKLDRSGGSFGHVDSFVYVYRLRMPGALERVAAFDVSDDGVVVPKAIAITVAGDVVRVDVTAFGSDKAVELELPRDHVKDGPVVRRVSGSVPGIASMTRFGDGYVAADPLLDAYVRLDGGRVEITPAEPDRPDAEADVARLGELLAFTTLIAPWQSSEGALSRFTCETCHFEGGVDGRTHRTGRGETTATTKPLWGLFNNAPHFTRALDQDTAETVYAEFRVAGANGDGPTWFSIEDADAAWWSDAPFASRVDGSPPGLRRALLHYLRAARPPAKARESERSSFSDLEAEGARVFERRCESCHAARLRANDATTRVQPSGWEALILSEASPIVWARDGWEKTGVEPYVHPDGARPSSLRRISTRRPYFTTGAARSLDDVLARARVGEGSFFHDHAPADATPLDAGEQQALRAFLELL